MVRILIADDANLIRQALSIYFKLESDLEIVGTAENGKKAINLVEELNPDIVLMDMEMPEMDGLTATQIICQHFSRTKVLVLSSHNSQDYIDKALNAGANGYFIKNMPVEELSAAIKLIHQQNVRIIPALSGKESYVVLPNSLSSTNQTELSPDLVFNTQETENNSENTEQERIISANTDSSELLSYLIKNCQLNQLNQQWSELSSSPLAHLPKFSAYLNPVTNKKRIVVLCMFSMLGAATFLASIIKYKITVRANAQIHSTSDIIEDWKQGKQFANVGAISRSPIIAQNTTFKEQPFKHNQQAIQYPDHNLGNDSIEKVPVGDRQPLVPSEDLINQISPSQVPLLVKAAVPSHDIAKVEKDQEVQLKLFGCPYAHYGTLQGKTIGIIPDIPQPLRQKEPFFSKQKSNSVDGTYEVTIEPVSMSLHKAQHECKLKSGMKAKADIIIQEETILALILRKARLIN